MKKFVIVLPIIFMLGALSVEAQTSRTPNNPTSETKNIKATIVNPFKCPNNDCTIQGLLRAIIDGILIPIGSVAAVLAFIWSGFLFVTAQGKPDKLDTAKRALLYTAIGTAVLLGAWTLSKVITGTIDALKT